jgi:hypothetical protein
MDDLSILIAKFKWINELPFIIWVKKIEQKLI